MSRFDAGAIYWLGIWFIGGFVVPELLAVFGKMPFTTLSEFCWEVEGLAGLLRYVFLIGLAILLVHIVARWP